MNIRIVSDGTTERTKVLTEDGEELTNVTSIDWHLDCNKSRLATAKVTFIKVPVEVVAAAESHEFDLVKTHRHGHYFECSGGSGGWEVWECRWCGRSTMPGPIPLLPLWPEIMGTFFKRWRCRGAV